MHYNIRTQDTLFFMSIHSHSYGTPYTQTPLGISGHQVLNTLPLKFGEYHPVTVKAYQPFFSFEQFEGFLQKAHSQCRLPRQIIHDFQSFRTSIVEEGLWGIDPEQEEVQYFLASNLELHDWLKSQSPEMIATLHDIIHQSKNYGASTLYENDFSDENPAHSSLYSSLTVGLQLARIPRMRAIEVPDDINPFSYFEVRASGKSAAALQNIEDGSQQPLVDLRFPCLGRPQFYIDLKN